jgi:acetyl-CoA acyltransferase
VNSERSLERAAIVAGCRTPFSKAGTALRNKTAVDLARHAVVELVQRANLDGEKVDEVYFGQVLTSPLEPNLAREVSLIPQLPKDLPAASVNRACASANQAVVLGCDQIVLGHTDVVIAGGAESLSNVPVLHSQQLSQTLMQLSRSKSIKARAKLLAAVQPRHLLPVTPAIAEPSTGETMGQAAEKMAKINGISREDQDRFALRSHRLASAATRDGRLQSEIAPVLDGGLETPVMADNGIRADTSLEQLSNLPPVFDGQHGTVTAGTSSPLTDGAVALLLMSESAARALGYEPLAFVRSYAFAALDPGDQLLMGPVFAIPKALARAELDWSDIGLVEMHEAFAAQVLSNLKAIESKAWAEEHFSRDTAIGEVNWEALNVGGGSIALGHPFGATGGRVTLTLANEMVRRDIEFGLVSVCAQGGMGFAMVLERS